MTNVKAIFVASEVFDPILLYLRINSIIFQGFTREQKPKFCSGLVSMKKLFENVRKIVCSREASTYINSLSNQINMAKKK